MASLAAGALGLPPDPYAGVLPPSPLPLRTVQVNARNWFRVHNYDPGTKKYLPEVFNNSGGGDARFSPLFDPVSGNVIPTIYGAATPTGAIAEITLHDVPNPSAGYSLPWSVISASNQHLSEVFAPDLKLANFTTTGLKAAGLKPEYLFSGEKPDYPRTRLWALHAYQTLPDAQGIVWMSVRDNTCMVVMLFEDRLPPKSILPTGLSTPIAAMEPEVEALLEQLGAAWDKVP